MKKDCTSMSRLLGARRQIQIIWVFIIISFILTGSGSVWALSFIKDIEVDNPSGVAVNELDGNTYVLNLTTIAVIEGQTNEISDMIDLRFPKPLISDGLISTIGLPKTIMWNPADQNLYVTVEPIYRTQDGDRFLCGPMADQPNLPCATLVIDGATNQVINTIPIEGFDLQDMAFNRNNNQTYVVAGNCIFGAVIGDCARQSRGEVLTIDGLANESSSLAQVGYSPKGITVDPDNMVYVANQLSDNISIINGSSGSILNNVTLQGGRPIEILYNSFNEQIYVTNGFKNSVDVIDGQTNQVIKSIDVGDIPNGISSTLLMATFT